ncbi:MAG: tRNA A37 methylthiotransferase MiaB [Halioglobus sp.]|jgi:tRNA A37 methylthiotransferase MiaB
MHNVPKIRVFPLALARGINHLPYLSIGMVTAYLRQHDNGALEHHYDLGKVQVGGIKGYPLQDIYRQLGQAPAAICLLSSYVWNHSVNIQAAQEIKRRNATAVIIIGGPEIPKYVGETEAFLHDNPAIDIAVLGEGEMACAQILAALKHATLPDLSPLLEVPGIVYRQDDELHRTADRNRLKDIDQLPSPYLTGEFEPWFHGFENTILETNRGCPYGCTYCDWGSATLERVSKFSLPRVKAEIDYIAQSKAESIFIADANFGMLEQDIDIAKSLVEARARTGYPKRLYTNFAKNGGRRLMSVIEILHDGGLLPTGIIALQTTDEAVLQTIKRDNIKTASYEKMMAYFNSRSIPMASDLMIGLPGQTIDSLARDLQFCFDWKVSANGNYTSMMPNAPMAEPQYMKDNMIVTDANSMVASTSTFTEADLGYMKSLYSVYMFHVKLGVLKYYLYFLQVDHGVPAMTLLRRWLDAVLDEDPDMPISVRVFTEIFAMETRTGDWAQLSWDDDASFLFGDIQSYFEEIHSLVEREFNVVVGESERQAIFSVQSAVNPSVNRSYPHQLNLSHDVHDYFDKIKQAACLDRLPASMPRLADLSSGSLIVGEIAPVVRSIAFSKIMGHADEGWELKSGIRFY